MLQTASPPNVDLATSPVEARVAHAADRARIDATGCTFATWTSAPRFRSFPGTPRKYSCRKPPTRMASKPKTPWASTIG